MSFDIKITGKIKGLDKDLEKEYKAIEKQIPSALQYVGEEMKNSLREHLEKDWYDWYQPKVYKRRTDNPSYGRPLSGDRNFAILSDRNELAFIYSPTGEHAIKKWDERDGNDLIEWLQSNHEMGESIIPARPFWNNFVEEQENGAILSNFIRGMYPKYVVVKDKTDKINLKLTESYLDSDE